MENQEAQQASISTAEEWAQKPHPHDVRNDEHIRELSSSASRTRFKDPSRCTIKWSSQHTISMYCIYHLFKLIFPSLYLLNLTTLKSYNIGKRLPQRWIRKRKTTRSKNNSNKSRGLISWALLTSATYAFILGWNSRWSFRVLTLKSVKAGVALTPIWRYIVYKWSNTGTTLVQTFLRSLIRATLAWFTKLNIAKIKRWIDLAHLFIVQYKSNSEIAPREQLHCMFSTTLYVQEA